MLKVISSFAGVRCVIFTVFTWFCLSPLSFAVGNITLAWDPSPDASVVGYKVHYGSTSGLYTNSVSVGSATTTTISNLAEGVTYYFSATSLDTNGWESIFSNETSGMVNVPNRVPTLNALSSFSVNEDAGTQTVNLSGISSGATNENQTLVITATSSNPSLIPHPTVSYTSPNAIGSLSLAPLPSVFGSATITVTVDDGGTTNNTISRTFTVTVNSVNDQPTLATISNLSINEDSGSRTINLAGISSGAANENQNLTVTAASSNSSLIPTPAVSYTSPNATGSLTFTPVAGAFGSSTITVTVNDGGTSNNTVTRSFTVTVNSVNDSPTLNTLANVSINQDAGLQVVNLSGISSGAANENQTLALTATCSNPSLIPTPTLTYSSPNTTGSLAFTPAAGSYGSAVITVTVNDGGSSNNTVSRSFTVTVNQVNQPPFISAITNRIIAVNSSTAPIPFTIGDAETPATGLTLSVSSDNQVLVPNQNITLGGSSSDRFVTVTPEQGRTGIALITITVGDGTTAASSAFQLTVNPRPPAPSNLRVTLQ